MTINTIYNLIDSISSTKVTNIVYEPVDIECVSSEIHQGTLYIYDTPIEIQQRAQSLGVSVMDYLISLI